MAIIRIFENSLWDMQGHPRIATYNTNSVNNSLILLYPFILQLCLSCKIVMAVAALKISPGKKLSKIHFCVQSLQSFRQWTSFSLKPERGDTVKKHTKVSSNSGSRKSWLTGWMILLLPPTLSFLNKTRIHRDLRSVCAKKRLKLC